MGCKCDLVAEKHSSAVKVSPLSADVFPPICLLHFLAEILDWDFGLNDISISSQFQIFEELKLFSSITFFNLEKKKSSTSVLLNPLDHAVEVNSAFL